MAGSSKRRKAPVPKRVRLSPDARRRQLLEVAAEVLTRHGVEAVQISEVATRAGVTRPIVYRYFPTREALVLAVLEDFGEALDAAYRDALLGSMGQGIDVITRAFVEASCRVIEAKGAGPWRLLESRGVGQAIGRAGLELHDRLFSPWLTSLAELSGRSETELAMALAGVVAMGRSALDHWIDGFVPREAAIEHAARGVRALLEEFARGPVVAAAAPDVSLRRS